MRRFTAVLLLVLSSLAPLALAADPPRATSENAKQPPFAQTHYVRGAHGPKAASVMPPQRPFHLTHYVRTGDR